MCHGNLAEASASYINAQLNALWANSKVCSDKEGLGRVPRDDVVKRGVAFREFFGPESQAGNSVVFHAVFNAPQVEFICDHELVLTLDIKDGQYNVETSSATFANTKLAVRLSYRVQDIIAPLVGGNTVISVLTVDSASGSIVFGRSTSESKVDMGTLFQVVKTYYFPTIFSGLLNLFVLPASYTNKQTIDHGVLVKGIMPRDLLFGIDVAKINAILSGRWLAAIYAAKSNSSKNSDTFLSHYQPQWEINGSPLYSNIQLQAMRIQVLCDQEVVLFVKGDINFYRDQALQIGSAALKGWELAIIFSVVYRDGRILLTQSRAPRIIDNLCTMPGGFIGVDKLQAQFRSIILGRYCQLIFQYKHEQLYPDFPPPHPHGSEGPKPIPCPKPDPTKWPLPCPRPHPDEPYCPGGKVDINWGLLWRQFIPETSLHDYHRITTVTQAGLNAHFAAIWQKAQAVIASTSTTTFTEVEQRLAILGHFDSKQAGANVGTDGLPHFVADFGVPQVEFLTHSNSKSVIMYFNVKKIAFETSDKAIHEYKDWLLAFQFDLELLSKDLTKEGSITEGTGLAGYRQLTLKSSAATFLHDRSTFADLLNDKESQVLRALYPYLQDAFTQRYISAFVQKGQNILYTLPIHSQQHLQNKPDTHGRAHAMTDVDFTIVPFSLKDFDGEVFQGIGGPAHHIVERNMIVFHGVVGNEPLNKKLLAGPYGAPSVDPPHGTLLLAKEVFLDSQLLKPLAEVNALSTILCQLVGVSKDGDWNLELRSWKTHPSKSSDDCIWKPDTAWEDFDKSIQYQWKTEEEWRYESEGMGTRDATFTLETKTTNTLVIPTNHLPIPTNTVDAPAWDVTNPLMITISGVTHVHMACDATREDEHWKGSFEAKWTVPVTLVSDAKDGVYVQTLEENVTLDFEDDRSLGLHPKGVAALDAAKAKYREVFGQNPINTTSILDGINKSFKGVFQGLMMPITSLVLSKPVFNSNGDLLLHLVPQGAGSATTGTTATPTPQPVSTSTKQAGLIQKTAEESGNFLAGLLASKPAAPSISLPTLAIPSNPSPTSSLSQTLTNNTPFPSDSAPASSDKSADGYFSAIDAAKTTIPVAVDASNVSPTGVVSEKPPVQQDIQASELQANQVWNA